VNSGPREVSTKLNESRTNDSPPDYEVGSGILVKLRRLAIRAAKFEPEADYASWTVSEIHSDGISVVEKKRGAIKGPIRIPLHSPLFLFSALAFPSIPSNSLKFRTVVFSIPTAPTNHPFSQQQLSDLSRRQKAAIRASRVAPMARRYESLRCCAKVGHWTSVTLLSAADVLLHFP
jgi:hypothetical protein